MHSLSGMSLILTVALVTLISMECCKNTNTIENYTELDDIENFGEDKSEKKKDTDIDKYINEKKKEDQEFQNNWITRLNISKPTNEQLKLIGSDPKGEFPYGNSFIPKTEETVPSGSDDRSKNVGLCAQNYNTFGISTLGQPAQGNVASSLLPTGGKDTFGNVASSLLPTGGKDTFGNVASSLLPNVGKEIKGEMKGFEDCNTRNVLASQFLLTDTAIGIDTTNGSKKDQLYDIRPAPANPHDFVGIWGISTKYENLERKELTDCVLR